MSTTSVQMRGEKGPALSRRGFCLTGLGLLGACAGAAFSPGSEAAAQTGYGISDSLYQVSVLDTQREILANGIANHVVGVFPNQDCPCTIQALSGRYLVERFPSVNSYPTPLQGWLFGIASSGVPFDPTGPFWDVTTGNVWEFEVMSTLVRPYLGLDGSNAHVQPNGEYHYHGIPNGLISRQRKGVGRYPAALGWAADGFPIYGPVGSSDPWDPHSTVKLVSPSYRLREGKRPSGAPMGVFDGTYVQDYEYVPGSGDLDECNGRWGVVPDFPEGTYHYYITGTFPFIPRFYRGTPDVTFTHPLPGADALPPWLSHLGR